MRNLKRALSLVLAAAMLIGMMVVSASAVSYNDFSDRGEIVNKDAVSMLTTLEIIEGKPDGSYAPGENVDRAQMAKMISVMLSNNQNCDDLYMNVNSGLTDISANWAKGYINYCYTLGVIAGRGNGTFDPSANVTAVEAAKMLLTALGYEAEIEGLVGDDWALNTAALAHELGIFRNFDKDVSAPLNRDDAALLIYNAMDVEMIEQYQNGYALSYADHRTILSYVFGVIRVEGVVVANEWAQLQQTDSDAALREGRTTLANVVWYDSTTSNTRVEEGVKETEPVTFNVTTPVEYMGKAVTMYVEKTTILANSKVLGVATNDEANVLNFTAEGQDTVKDYLKGTGVSVNEDTQYYVNYGYFKNEDAAIDWINEYHHTEDQGNDFSLNGIEVQVIDNDKDGVAEYVLYLQETLSEVARYNERNETVAFYEPDRDSAGKVNLKTPAGNDDAVTTVTEDMADVVLADDVSLEGVVTSENVNLDTEALILYVQYGGRTYISNPDIVTGKMTRIDRDKNDELFITIDDGDPHYQSYILDAASMVDVDVTRFIIEQARTDVGFDTTYDFILDSNGYIVAFRPAEEVVTNYALVLESAWTQNALDRSGQIKILMADGTEKKFDLNWDDSADAFDGITNIRKTDVSNAAGYDSDERLEFYLGSRDVVQDDDGTNISDQTDTYKTNRAKGSIITYSLNEAGDELTIESVLQGNSLDPVPSLEIDNNHSTTSASTTAGVGDNGTVIFMDGESVSNNLQYTANGYDNGYGRITVAPSNSTNENMVARTGSKTYAVDLNTVAFYYWYDDSAEKYVYGVATGWNNMSDVNIKSDVQVYPVLEKVTNATYDASNLAEVILFEAEPNTVAQDYMLVLSRNAIGKDMLELNVVFEDGTAETITIDDEGEFKEDEPDSYMQAWSYSENADGTYDIGSMWERAYGTADLLIDGTVDLNDGDYLALPDTANVWDVTEVNSGDDDVTAGHFQKNVQVNTVIIVSEGQVRTAWIWDLDDDAAAGNGYNFNWDTTGFVDVYGWYGDDWARIEMLRAFADSKSVRYWGDLELTRDLVIPDGLILQVEGDVSDLDSTGVTHDITGGGTLRVRNDYTVYGGSIDVNTQVGGNLYLGAANTTTNARVGVYQNIVGSTTAYDEKNPQYSYCVNDLTVNRNSNVFANEDILVNEIVVYGHVESDNYHIYGGYVYSDTTLIALENIYLYGGNALVIGGADQHDGLGTIRTGRVEVYGNIVANAPTSKVQVINGTLKLARSSFVSLKGDLEVGAKGVIDQPNGGSYDLVADEVTIADGGQVKLGRSIVANQVTNHGDLWVTTTPDNMNPASTGEIHLRSGSDDTTTETPVTSGLELSSVTVKGETVALNHDAKTGTVSIGWTEGAKLEAKDVVAKDADGVEVDDVKVEGKQADGYKVAITLKDTVTSGSTTTEVSTTYTITVTVREKSNDTSVASVKIKGETATASASDATKYTVDLTYAQATATDVRRAEITPNNNATLNDSINGAGMNNGDGANTAALDGVGDGSKDVTLTINFTITAEDGTTKEDYTVTVNVAKKPAQDAKVTLTDNGTEGVKLVPSGDDAYELIVRGKASNVDVTKLDNWVKAKGVGSAAITGDNTVKKDNVFTITFKGVDGGEDQKVTVTARSATADERAQWDLEAIKAAFPDGGHANISVDAKSNSDAVLSALKTEIEKKATWESGAEAECSFNVNNDWNTDDASAGNSVTRSMHIKVTVGTETHEADLTVTIKVPSN